MSAAKTIVRQLLSELPAVQAAIGERIYADQAPQQQPPPYVLLQLLSTDPGTLGNLPRATVQIEIVAKTHDVASTLNDQLAALHELRRQVGAFHVKGVFITDRALVTEQPRTGEQGAFFIASTTLELWYRQTS